MDIKDKLQIYKDAGIEPTLLPHFDTRAELNIYLEDLQDREPDSYAQLLSLLDDETIKKITG